MQVRDNTPLNTTDDFFDHLPQSEMQRRSDERYKRQYEKKLKKAGCCFVLTIFLTIMGITGQFPMWLVWPLSLSLGGMCCFLCGQVYEWTRK